MRNYNNFNKHLNNLCSDIYEQPPDDGHKDFARAAIKWACQNFIIHNVLDIGCGQGFCRSLFEDEGIGWLGITTGKDYEVCQREGLPVTNNYATFIDSEDNRVDTVFARHILEHSPFPILTLMEWKRVATSKLILIYPAYEYWGVGGRNHYYVLDKERLWYNLTRAGWWPIHEKTLLTTDHLYDSQYPSREDNKEKYPGAPRPVEYWYVCKQGKERID
jgi:SAM-dependent methyltransferase